MKTNLYYSELVQPIFNGNRKRKIAFIRWAIRINWLLQVFIRKDFGERYFSFFAAFQLSVLLGLLPWAIFKIKPLLAFISRERDNAESKPSFMDGYWLWYAFLLVFLIFSYLREREIIRSRSSFNFQLYSVFSGFVHPIFRNIKFKGIGDNYRVIECYIEPLPYFILGIILAAFGENLGYLLVACSIIYLKSHRAAYSLGDDFILDKIDERLANRSLAETFLGTRSSDRPETRTGTPQDEETAEKLKSMISEEEITYVAE